MYTSIYIPAWVFDDFESDIEIGDRIEWPVSPLDHEWFDDRFELVSGVSTIGHDGLEDLAFVDLEYEHDPEFASRVLSGMVVSVQTIVKKRLSRKPSDNGTTVGSRHRPVSDGGVVIDVETAPGDDEYGSTADVRRAQAPQVPVPNRERRTRRSDGMRFDTLLTRAESLTLGAEVAALRTPTRVLARGVHQDRSGRGWQFQMVVDEPNQAWTFDQQGEKHREHYSDGVLHTVDGPLKLSFEQSAPHPVRMITPELMLQWGPPASYLPILVQRIRDHWLLFTFEHDRDPAERISLVIDERTGIARRSYKSGELTIITEVRTMQPDEPVPARPRFKKLTEIPPLEYLQESE